jgi:hypothetical protein
MTGLKVTQAAVVHEAFMADEAREQAGMLDELAHLNQASKKPEDPILGRRGRLEEDNTSLMVSGGVV